MKKKPFSLSGILKIRKYKETVALQEFMRKTQHDRELASQIEALNSQIEDTMQLMQKSKEKNMDLDEMRYIYNYVNTCNIKKENLQKERNNIREEVIRANEAYNKVRLELESVKILEDKHNEEQKKLQEKNFYNQIQEGAML